MKQPFVITILACSVLGACDSGPEVVAVDEVEEDEVEYSLGESEGELVAWDTDSDGQFSQAEYTNFGARAWSLWNTDRDTALGPDEFVSGWVGAGLTNPEGAFAAFDDDGDGLLQESELFDQQEWTEWDTDSSGMLEPGEFSYYRN